MKNWKLAIALLCAVVLTMAGIGVPVAHAVTVDSLTVGNLFGSLGEATQYGVVAREWDQGGHAETNACVDVLDRHVNTVFSNTGSTYFHALGYVLEAEVTAPANTSLNGMTFALFKESEDGTGLVLIDGSRITLDADVSTATLTWDIDGLSDDALKDLKNTRLYVRQVNADGTYVDEAARNEANLVVNYGPSISASAYNSNYFGKIYYPDGVPDSIGIFNTTGNTPGIVLGAETRLYYQNSAGEYVQFDPEDTTINTQYVMVNVYYGEPEQMTYAKLDGISVKDGVFTKNGDVIKISYSDETSRAADLLEDAEAYSKYLGNLGGGEITSLTPNPEGSSTVHGPLENGQVVSLYDVEVGADGVFKVKDDMGWDGIPVAENEYVVINLICPSKDGEVLVGPGAADVTYFYKEGQQTGEGVQWGTEDSNSSQRVIFNFVYADENGVMQPFEGTIIPHSRHGGTLLAPKANVSVTGEVHNGSIIADNVYNDQETHQRSLAAGSRSTWVVMNGGYVSLGKASLGYDWTIPPYGEWVDMSDEVDLSGAVFGIYSDESCSEDSLVGTMETGEDGVATSGLISAGTYWIKELVPLKDHNLETRVIEVTIEPGKTTQAVGGGYWVQTGYWQWQGEWVIPEEKFVNQQNNGYTSLRLLKHDEFGNELQGATFGVYSRHDSGYPGPNRYTYTLVASGSTNRYGVTIIENVPLSYQNVTYYIREISAPDGYSAGSDRYVPITLTPDDRDKIITIDGNGDAEGIAFVNNVIRGNMGLKKVDAKTNANLEGAEFTIYSDKACTQVVGVMTTKRGGDADSRNVIEGKNGLVPGTYYVKETKAPDGYMADDTVYTVKVVADKMVDVVTGNEINRAADATPITNDQAIHIYGTKVWYDEGYENSRPNEVKVALYKGNQFLREVTVKAPDWTFEFLNLPRYEENGDEIQYTVRENLAGKSYDYYAYVDGIDGSGNVSIVVANSIRRVEITGEKAWEDTVGYDPDRPETITFLLYQEVDGELVPMLDDQDQHMTTTGGSWNKYKFEFKNLPFYDATGAEATYVVKEAESGKYLLIDTTMTETEEQNRVKLHFTLTNRLTVPLAGTKVWQDSSDHQGRRPENVTLVVYCNGTRMDPQPEIVWDKETDADVWAWSVDHLPKYDANNNLNTYTVKEEPIPAGYVGSVSEDGLTFYNTIYGNIQLYKRNDTNTTHLNGAQFKLYYDAECQNPVFGDQVFETASRNGRNGWLIIENVVPGNYYILEVKAPLGYALPNPNRPIPVTVVAGVNDNRVNSHLPSDDPSYRVVLNTKEGEDTTIEVNKTWVGDAGKEDARPQSVTIQLYQNGAPMAGKTLELNASNNWSGEFTKLPSVDENDASYVYTVKEAAVVPGYVGSVTGSVEDGFTVTNTYNNTEITVTKAWAGPVAAADMSPVTVQLLADGVAVEGKTAELSNANNWTFTFENLPIADANGNEIVYTVEETAELPNFTVTYTGDKESGLVVTNTAKVGRITLKKVDAETGAALAGAKFSIYSDAECQKWVADMTTGNDGVATSGDLLPGTYYVKETAAPNGYKIGKTDAVAVEVLGDQTVTAMGDGTDGVFTNTQGKGKLYVKKVGTDSSNNNAQPLEGAEFTVYKYVNGQQTEVGKMVTNDEGYAEIELPMGDYMVKETKAPEGYKINDTSEKWVTIRSIDEEVWVKGGFTYNNEYGWFQNTSTAVGSIKLVKVSAADTNVKLQGAVFGVYYDQNCQNKAGEMTTDANGEATYTGLEANREYWVKEITAPAGYELSDKVYSVRVEANTEKMVNDGNPIPNEAVREKGAISLTKVSAEDDNTKLQGAVFGVYSDEDCTQEVGRMTTDGNGQATCENLFAGETYWVKEITAPSGYVLSDAKYSVTVVANTTTAVNDGNAITNEKQKTGSIKLTKVSAVDANTKLAGAVFGVYADQNCQNKIGEMTTDVNGEATLDNLTPGSTYWVKEIVAPSGYKLNNNVYSVTVVADATTAVNDGNAITNEEQEGGAEYYFYKGTKETGSYAPLKGAEFTLYGDSNCTQVITRATSDSEGRVTFRVPVDINQQVYIKETKAPAGYDPIPDGTYSFHASGSSSTPQNIGWCFGSLLDYSKEGGFLVNNRGEQETGGFQFTKKAADGTVLPGAVFGVYAEESCTTKLYELTSDENGIVSLKDLEAGSTYYIKEITAPSGYVLNEKVYNVTIEAGVDDKLVGDNGVIVNELYTAKGEITFAGVKNIDGRKMTEKDIYTFEIKEGEKVIATVSNDATGVIAYPTIKYTLADIGTHTYTVKETSENGKGITVDTKSYTVTVKVEDNGDGTLKVTASDNAKALNFTNTYAADGSVQFAGTKTLTGKTLAENEFSFVLT
ncbi:MAG: Cna B-type domain-containing protein, partial [Clostridia bacterium]|nr:Cna B-type domain-containing protein [Clostridia bacterium]